MNQPGTVILGAGVTGLAAGFASGLPIFEVRETPGGICSSYYVRPGEDRHLAEAPSDGEAYRFEVGGGHWIFGGDPAVLRFIRTLTPARTYARRSSVYFSRRDLKVPYPLQNHLKYLGKKIALKALEEMAEAPTGRVHTMADWLEQEFGRTLTDYFFGPFHELYTDGLWTRVAPQDSHKSPVNLSLVLKGAFDETPPVGYNLTYIYPAEGLDTLARRMARSIPVHYGKKVEQINVREKKIYFSDGNGISYEFLIATLPLNRMMELTGLTTEAETDPCTSVLVLNIGATRGFRCPDDHWLYIPDSRSGFHRVGFYSNVDVSFLPTSSQADCDRTSIYVERAYRSDRTPSRHEVQTYTDATVQELKDLDFIGEAEVIDPTWIDGAYTWSLPGSQWKTQALTMLEKHNIYQVGRYARWAFDGIANSIKDGFAVGSAFRQP
jgi:protoporphyrinogen oxidase